MTTRLVHSVCQTQFRQIPLEESPQKPFLAAAACSSGSLSNITTLSPSIDVHLNVVTNDAEFETH